MLAFQWNALRVGDPVLVHDDGDRALTLHAGVVELVQTRRAAANELAIRVDHDPSRIVRPRRQAVHIAPIDRRFVCWRCDGMAAGSAGVADADLAA